MYIMAFLQYKVLRNVPTSPCTCPTSPLLTANTLPVFCFFQLRSVTYKRLVRSHDQKELEGQTVSAGRLD